MDKAEYRIKLEQINNLAENGDFKGAAAIADTIEWKRVKSVRTLCMIGEIYEANRRYSDSEQILKYAYRQSSSSKTVLYRLAEIEIRMGFYDEAKKYYQEFEELSPHDTSRYILKYKLLRAQGAPLPEQIEVLREYKEREYTERWAFELARLYKKNGQKQRCIEECDDMILWFAEGKYVTRAMELKMQLEPLSEAQQKRYDNRHKAAIEAERRAIPDDDLNGFDRVQRAINRADEEDYELRPERQKKVTAAEAIQKMNAAADEAVTSAIFEEKTPNVRPGIRTGRGIGRSSDIQDQIASSFREAVSSIRKPRQIDYTDLYSEEEEPGEDFEETFKESNEDRGNAELEALFAETGSMFARELADTFGVRSGSSFEIEKTEEAPEPETDEIPEAEEEKAAEDVADSSDAAEGTQAEEEVSEGTEDALAEAESSEGTEEAQEEAESSEEPEETQEEEEESEEPEEAQEEEEVSKEPEETQEEEEISEETEETQAKEEVSEESEETQEEAEVSEEPEEAPEETENAFETTENEEPEYVITEPEIEESVAYSADALEPVDPSEAADMVEGLDRSLVEGADEDFDLSSLTDEEEAEADSEETVEEIEEVTDEAAETEADEVFASAEEEEAAEAEAEEVLEAADAVEEETAEAEKNIPDEIEMIADEAGEAEEEDEAAEADEAAETEADEVFESAEEDDAAEEAVETETDEVSESAEAPEEVTDEAEENIPDEIETIADEAEEAVEAAETALELTDEESEAVEIIEGSAEENTDSDVETAFYEAQEPTLSEAEEIEEIKAGDSDEADIPCEKRSSISSAREEEISDFGSIDSAEDAEFDEEDYEPYDLEAEAEALREFGEKFSEIEREAAEIAESAAESQPRKTSGKIGEDIAPIIYDSEHEAEEAAVKEELKAEAEELTEAGDIFAEELTKAGNVYTEELTGSGDIYTEKLKKTDDVLVKALEKADDVLVEELPLADEVVLKELTKADDVSADVSAEDAVEEFAEAAESEEVTAEESVEELAEEPAEEEIEEESAEEEIAEESAEEGSVEESVEEEIEEEPAEEVTAEESVEESAEEQAEEEIEEESAEEEIAEESAEEGLAEESVEEEIAEESAEEEIEEESVEEVTEESAEADESESVMTEELAEAEEAELDETTDTASEELAPAVSEEISEEKPYFRKIRPVTEESVVQEIAEGTQDVLEESVPEAVWASLSRRMASAVERMSAKTASAMSWDNETDSYDEEDLKSTIEPEEETEPAEQILKAEDEMGEELESPLEESVEEEPESVLEESVEEEPESVLGEAAEEESEPVEDLTRAVPEFVEEAVTTPVEETVEETGEEVINKISEAGEAAEEIEDTAEEAVEAEEVIESVSEESEAEEVIESVSEESEAEEIMESVSEAEAAGETPAEADEKIADASDETEESAADLTEEVVTDVAVAVEETIGEAEAAVQAAEAEVEEISAETSEDAGEIFAEAAEAVDEFEKAETAEKVATESEETAETAETAEKAAAEPEETAETAEAAEEAAAESEEMTETAEAAEEAADESEETAETAETAEEAADESEEAVETEAGTDEEAAEASEEAASPVDEASELSAEEILKSMEIPTAGADPEDLWKPVVSQEETETLLGRETDESLGLTREFNFQEELRKARAGDITLEEAAKLVYEKAEAEAESTQEGKTEHTAFFLSPEEEARKTVMEAAGKEFPVAEREEENVTPEPAEPDEAVEEAEEPKVSIKKVSTPIPVEDIPKEIFADESDEPLTDEAAEDVSDILSAEESSFGRDTNIIEHIMTEPEMVNRVPVLPRKFDDTERKIFSYFSNIPGMQEQITLALADIHNNSGDKTSRAGNVLIIGRQKSGKTKLAEGLMLAVCKDLHIQAAKKAKIIATDLNKKDPAKVVKLLAGGFLLIEGAGSMYDETIEKLSKAMEFRTDGLVVILEDEKRDIRAMLNSHPELAEKFTSTIIVPVFTNDELVTFARTYARENGYKFDELATLALYTLIGENQKDSEPMTVGMVKELVDQAIDHSKSRRFGFRSKNQSTPDGRILLREKDFS